METNQFTNENKKKKIRLRREKKKTVRDCDIIINGPVRLVRRLSTLLWTKKQVFVLFSVDVFFFFCTHSSARQQVKSPNHHLSSNGDNGGLRELDPPNSQKRYWSPHLLCCGLIFNNFKIVCPLLQYKQKYKNPIKVSKSETFLRMIRII